MLTDAVQRSLKDVFGFDEFRPGQAEVMGHLMEGRSALAVFPTGGGKSLCYQLPALHLRGLTLVVSPLIALMKDQIDFLTAAGVRAARLDSSLSGDEVRAVYDEMRAGTLKLLYVAPERFSNERFVQRLRGRPISLMAIDEAHCISEWGHNFRPDYLKLARLARELGARRVLGLTATATPEVARDILRGFQIEPEAYVNTGYHRPNLVLRLTSCSARDRDELLLARLREREPGPTIVYVTLQRTAEKVAGLLARHGLDARAYHAGMKSEDRHAVQDWFMAGQRTTVVATIAFGMGIDKADIRHVYHYNLPKSLENYAQEIGRAGRDGQPSTCEVLACSEDTVTLENFSFGDTPGRHAVEALVTEVLGLGRELDVSFHELSRKHDIRLLVVSTLMTYLELEGVLAATGPFYNTYRFQPRRTSKQILADHDEARARLLRGILSQAQKRRVWFDIDVGQTVVATGATRAQVVGALCDLEEQGDLELRVTGIRQGYRLLQPPRDMDGLVTKLADRFLAAEQRDMERIRGVLDLAGHEGCVVRELLSYFGEELDGDCGHCDRCLGEREQAEATAPEVLPGAETRDLIKKLRHEAHPALARPRQMARFLCGLSSPATSYARPSLIRHPSFGSLAGVPFTPVLNLAAEQMGDAEG